jgi:hypothetical protein
MIDFLKSIFSLDGKRHLRKQCAVEMNRISPYHLWDKDDTSKD